MGGYLGLRRVASDLSTSTTNRGVARRGASARRSTIIVCPFFVGFCATGSDVLSAVGATTRTGGTAMEELFSLCTTVDTAVGPATTRVALSITGEVTKGIVTTERT